MREAFGCAGARAWIELRLTLLVCFVRGLGTGLQEVGVRRVMGFMLRTSQAGFDSVAHAADVVGAYQPHRPRPDEASVRRNIRQHPVTNRWYWRWESV